MGVLNKIRSVLYTSAKIFGDVNAIHKGKTSQRLKNRIVGKITSRLIKKR